jgi:hypothetical protein
MRSLWFILGIIICVVASCSTLHKYDPATATFGKETEKVPVWEIADREQEIMTSLEDHGKLKVIRVKEVNPVVQWVFGAGLAIGGILILLGIAFIWITKGVKLLDGLCISGAGVTVFATFYLLDAYLIWICIAGGVALLGSILYISIFKKDLTEKLIMSFEEQKEHSFGDVKKHVLATQGNKQEIISKLRKKVLR